MRWAWQLKHAIRLLRTAEARVQDRAIRAKLRELIDRAEDLLEGKEVA